MNLRMLTIIVHYEKCLNFKYFGKNICIVFQKNLQKKGNFDYFY